MATPAGSHFGVRIVPLRSTTGAGLVTTIRNMTTRIVVMGQGLFHDGLVRLLAEEPSVSVVGSVSSREQALEARRESVRLYTALVEQLPQAHMQNFLLSLRNYIKQLKELVHSPEEDPALQSSLEILRKLGALHNPDEPEPYRTT